MNSISRLSWSALALALSVAAVPVEAQVPTCAQALTTVNANAGYSRDQVAMAWYGLLRCGDSVPPAIASALRRATLNSPRDSLAQLAAWSLADRRLVDSIIVLSKDPSQATSRRLQFLGFLARYVNPHVVIDNNARGPGGGLALVELTDAIPFVGNQPIDQPASDRAYAAIVWMSTNDPNAETRRLAAAVAQQLKW